MIWSRHRVIGALFKQHNISLKVRTDSTIILQLTWQGRTRQPGAAPLHLPEHCRKIIYSVDYPPDISSETIFNRQIALLRSNSVTYANPLLLLPYLNILVAHKDKRARSGTKVL